MKLSHIDLGSRHNNMGRFRIAAEEEEEEQEDGDDGGYPTMIQAHPPPLPQPNGDNHAAAATRQPVGEPSHKSMLYHLHPYAESLCRPPGTFYVYETKPRGFFSRNWALLLSVCIVILAYACQHYLPPAPPPPTTTGDDDQHNNSSTLPSWSLYLQQHRDQLFQASKALFVETPYHVGSWWISNVWTELQTRWGSSSTAAAAPSSCVWRPQPQLRQDLARSIQGQSVAVELLADAVLAWDHRTSGSRPLIVLALGFPSTGKRSLALALVHSLYNDDDATTAASCATTAVLHIHGWDCTNQSQYYRLLRRIQHHCSSNQGGVLLLWTDVDQSDPSLVQQVLAHVQQQDDYSSGSTTSSSSTRILVYLTTSTGDGMTVLAEALRSHTLPGQLELRKEQHAYYYDAAVSLYLPFRPHTVESLTAMVRAQYTVTDAALAEMLAPVEYLEWRRRADTTTSTTTTTPNNADDDIILTMAVDGARALPLTKLRRYSHSTSSSSSSQKKNVMLHARGEAQSAACSGDCVPVVWDE